MGSFRSAETIPIWAGVVRPALGQLSAAGCDAAPILIDSGFSPAETLTDPDAFVPVSNVINVWSNVARWLDDPNLGLHVAETERLEDWDLLGYTMLAKPTVAEALDCLVRFVPFLSPGASYACEPLGGGRVVLRYDAVFRPEMPALLLEHELASMVSVIGQMLHVEWKPEEVRFRHGRHGDPHEQERVLGAPVTFDADCDGIVFDADILHERRDDGDAQLARVLDHHLQRWCCGVPLGDGFPGRVREVLVRRLPGAGASLPGVSSELGVSPRTAQRRLRDADTTYAELLDDLRRDLAQEHLGDPQRSISEIAYLLGYTDTTSFHRAFRRWTGSTPRAARGASAASGSNGSAAARADRIIST